MKPPGMAALESPAPSLYRRPLPLDQVAFGSAEGRVLFREALEAGTLEGFFPLIEQFHTQADPSFCSLGSLVMSLNALGIDPGRLWRGPWRWFSEELLDCCVHLDTVQRTGLSIEELSCLASCNGAIAELSRADAFSPAELRRAIEQAARAAGAVVIASYSRAVLGQTGSGHFSPIGGYHAARDLVLILDVARFKYPPHWVPLERLHAAMLGPDSATGRTRGWVTLRRRGAPSSLVYFMSCREGLGLGATLVRLVELTRAALEAARAADLGTVLRVFAACAADAGISRLVELRKPQMPEHEQMFQSLRRALTQSSAHRAMTEHLGAESSELLSAWLLAAPEELWAGLEPGLAGSVRALLDSGSLGTELSAEVEHVRRQVGFLLDHARGFDGTGSAGRTLPVAAADASTV